MHLIRSLFLALALLLALSVLPPANRAAADPAMADDSPLTLLPGARVDYRFDYKGDRTPIEVALDYGGVPGIVLSIYTPDAVQAAGRGSLLNPVGRGTPGAGHDAFWRGDFPAPGVYQVSIENNSPGIILYTLTITGPSVSGVARMLADPPAGESAALATNVLTVPLPAATGKTELRLSVPAAPATCTHSYQMPPIISASVKLCPNEIYPSLHIIGNNVALYGDDQGTGVITGGGRQFALTIDGSRNFIEGVTIQAGTDAADLGAWLCQYDECVFPTFPDKTVINGGLIYGGGVLLRGSNTTIHRITVRGGTIGIGTVNGWGNALIENRLNDLNGWGIYNRGSQASYFVGNTLNRENHACETPDGYKFLHGCETAGWVCLGCQANIVAQNRCEGSGNCFYMSGERDLASNNNRLVANYCAGATDNCFELTFSSGNVLQDNVTTSDPLTGRACKYPFWIGGSSVYLTNNQWQCSISPEQAIADATGSTTVPTLPILDGLAPLRPAASGATPSAAPGTPRPPTHCLGCIPAE